MTYNGFAIWCGCTCSRCRAKVRLEGYSDASGSHYCHQCDDYVPTFGACRERTESRVKARETRIIRAGALEE